MEEKQKLLQLIKTAYAALEEAETLCLEKKTTIPEDIRDDVYKLHDDAESLIEDLEE